MGRILLVAILIIIASAAQAAPQERIVLLPAHLPASDTALTNTVESIVADGLSRWYSVVSGARVTQRTHAVFAKQCAEIQCLQQIAKSFQSEHVAVVNIIRPADDYFVTIDIRNAVEGNVENSTSITCRRCDMGEVIARLKDLLGVHPDVTVTTEPIWTLAPTTMVWKDANEYCRSIGAHLPSLSELNELHVNGTLQQQARVQWGGSVWSSASNTRGVHFIVAPLQNTMMPSGDIARNSTACVK